MSLDFQSQVACPKCAKVGPFQQYQSVNTRSPELKAKLMSGELTRFTCAACGHMANVGHTLLYSDLAHDWMVYLVPGDDAARDAFHASHQTVSGLDPKVRTRMVWDLNGLREKINAIDAGLDDRLLEVTKLLVKTQNQEMWPDRILFEALVDERLHFARITDKGVARFNVPKSGTYAFSADKLAKAGVLEFPKDLWAVVGERWASWALEQATGRK